MATAIGRKVSIAVLDASGAAADSAELFVALNGAFAGVINLGIGGSGPITLEVDDPMVHIALQARLLGQSIDIEVPPYQDAVTLQFAVLAPHFVLGRQGYAHCPDGTSGSPCVTCTDANGVSWRICC